MANPNPKTENLTRAGKGRPRKDGRVPLNTLVDAATKEGLKRMGKMGDSIDRLYLENGKLRLQVHRLQQENEGLRDRLRGLSPVDLP